VAVLNLPLGRWGLHPGLFIQPTSQNAGHRLDRIILSFGSNAILVMEYLSIKFLLLSDRVNFEIIENK
jgi:hypothetical protein